MNYLVEDKLISIENLNFSIGGKKILRDIGTDKLPFEIFNLKRGNSEVSLGQIVAIVGRSGSGKSTLFKILTGLIKPSSGRVLVPNINSKGEYKTVSEGEVGFVQQNYPLSRNQSVREMLVIAASLGGYSPSDASKLIEEYLSDWELIEHKNKYANQLSGGQRQRVAIIEQLLCSHHFMVFDEPFSGLDIGNILDVRNSFRKIADKEDINTVIFSTHDIDIAVELADLIYVIGLEKKDSNHIEGGTMIEKIDLKQLGLAWKDYSSEHKELSKHICQIMLGKSNIKL